MTSEQIRILTAFAARILFKHPQFQPEDVVNDAILADLEKGLPLTFESLKPKIRNLCVELKLNNRGKKGDKFSIFETDRFCKGCNQVLPIAFFYQLTRKKYNIQEIAYKCKQCANRETENRRKNRLAQGGEIAAQERAKVSRRVQKYTRQNRNKWNRYIKERYQQDKETLSDSYCRKMLQKKYSLDQLNNNPQLIEEYRAKTLKKREAKSTFLTGAEAPAK